MLTTPNETPGLRTALVYDFDGTLAPGNIQEHSLIPKHLETTKEEFWDQVYAEKHGHSIAVFDPDRWANRELQGKVYNLIAEDRAHFVVPADYTDGSQLDITIKGILGRIARDEAGYRGGASE